MRNQIGAAAADQDSKQSSKRRGNYNCGRCGQPKKGHVCHVGVTTPAPDASSVADGSVISSTALPYKNLRRALEFKDLQESFAESGEEEDGEEGVEEGIVVEEGVVAGGLPVSCMWEVMRRMPPADLMAAAKVCTSWRDVTRKVWRSVGELKLRVPSTAMVGFVGSVLKKCPMLTRLNLRVERFD